MIFLLDMGNHLNIMIASWMIELFKQQEKKEVKESSRSRKGWGEFINIS